MWKASKTITDCFEAHVKSIPAELSGWAPSGSSGAVHFVPESSHGATEIRFRGARIVFRKFSQRPGPEQMTDHLRLRSLP